MKLSVVQRVSAMLLAGKLQEHQRRACQHRVYFFGAWVRESLAMRFGSGE